MKTFLNFVKLFQAFIVSFSFYEAFVRGNPFIAIWLILIVIFIEMKTK